MAKLNSGQRYLDVPFALDHKESLLDSLRIDVGEAGLDSPGKILDTLLEVGLKKVALVILDLPMLDGRSAKMIVKFDGLNGGCAGLILARLRAQPEVDIPEQLAPPQGSLQDDVRIAGMELAILGLIVFDSLEILYTNNVSTGFATGENDLII